MVAGYQPIMPPYAAQLSEEKVIQLIAYIKSLKDRGAPVPDASAAPSDAGVDAGVPDGGTDAGTMPGPAPPLAPSMAPSAVPKEP